MVGSLLQAYFHLVHSSPLGLPNTVATLGSGLLLTLVLPFSNTTQSHLSLQRSAQAAGKTFHGTRVLDIKQRQSCYPGEPVLGTDLTHRRTCSGDRGLRVPWYEIR